MNSKEALKSMCNHCEKLSIRDGFIGCPFRNISNDYCEEFETIKKDLELLGILKKYLYYDNKTHFIKMKQIRKSTFNFDYEDLKEWLGND